MKSSQSNLPSKKRKPENTELQMKKDLKRKLKKKD